MIDECWEDGNYYEIRFKTEQSKEFCRSVIVPLDISKEEVLKMFRLSFKNTIEILDISSEQNIWLSKEYFELRM